MPVEEIGGGAGREEGAVAGRGRRAPAIAQRNQVKKTRLKERQ